MWRVSFSAFSTSRACSAAVGGRQRGRSSVIPRPLVSFSSCRGGAYLLRSWLSPSSYPQLATVQSVSPFFHTQAVCNHVSHFSVDAEVMLSASQGRLFPMAAQDWFWCICVWIWWPALPSHCRHVNRKDGVLIALFCQHRAWNSLCYALFHRSCYSCPRSPKDRLRLVPILLDVVVVRPSLLFTVSLVRQATVGVHSLQHWHFPSLFGSRHLAEVMFLKRVPPPFSLEIGTKYQYYCVS